MGVRIERILLVTFMSMTALVILAKARFTGPAEITVKTAPAESRRSFNIPVNYAAPSELKHFLGLTRRRVEGIIKERRRRPLAGPGDLERVRELPSAERERIVPFLDFDTGDGE